MDFEDRARIHAAANGGAIKRAFFADEHSACGELLVLNLKLKTAPSNQIPPCCRNAKTVPPFDGRPPNCVVP